MKNSVVKQTKEKNNKKINIPFHIVVVSSSPNKIAIFDWQLIYDLAFSFGHAKFTWPNTNKIFFVTLFELIKMHAVRWPSNTQKDYVNVQL